MITGILFPVLSHAGLYEQLAISPTANSLGSAVTAYPEGFGGMAIHYNPAALTAFEGVRVDNGLNFIITKREVSFKLGIDPETGEKWRPFGDFFEEDPWDGVRDKQESGYTMFPIVHIGIPYLIAPALGISYKPPEPGTRLTFGFGNYVPFGVGLKNLTDDPAAFLGRKAFFVRMVLAAPAVAYKVTDTLSVGTSVGLGPSLIFFETSMRTPNTMVALTGALGQSTEGLEIPVISELTLPPPWFNGGMTPYAKAGELEFLVEDYLTTSYNLGLLWEPYDWFAFGACYQSESEATMEGDYKFTYGHEFQRTVDWLGRSPMTLIIAGMFDLPYKSVPFQKGTATVSATWPSRIQLGIKLKPVKQVTFTCDAHWTDWAAWPALEIEFDQKIQLLRFARMLGYTGGPKTMIVPWAFKNTWHLSYGLEIRPIKKIALRLGYEPRPTSIPDEAFGPMPLYDMQIFSAGIGITVEDKPKPKPEGLRALMKQLEHPSSVDLTVTNVRMKDKFVGYNGSKNLNSTEFTSIVYNPYAGLEWSQKMSIWIISMNQIFRW